MANKAIKAVQNSKPSAPKKPTAPKAVKPKAPVATVKAAKPGKPGRPAAPKASVTEPSNATKQAVATAKLNKIREIMADNESLTAQVELLTKKLDRARAAKSDRRSADDILDGAKMSDADWRMSYQGFKQFVSRCEPDGDALRLLTDEPAVEALMALPRDSDVGGQGTAARGAQRIALHWNVDENGAYRGAPLYVTEEELASLWSE